MKLLNIVRDKHSLVYKLALYVFSVIIVASLLPSDNRLTSTSITGLKIWPYNDLVAETDVFLSKPDTAIKRERLAIEKSAPFYFIENTEEKERNMARLQARAQSDRNAAKAYGLLKTIFETGVIERIDGLEHDKIIFVVKDGGEAEQYNYFTFFTIDKAVEFFETKLEDDPESEAILEICLEYLAVTIYFNKKLTVTNTNEVLNNLSVYTAYFKVGETLVKKHERITDEKRELLQTYFKLKDTGLFTGYMNLLGRFLMAITLLAILMLYLAYFRKNIFGQNRQVTFIFLIVIISAFVSYHIAPYGVLFFDAIPFALVAILIRVFFDSRTALFTFLMTILVCSFHAADRFQFVIIQLIAGMGTVFSIAQMQKRRALVTAAAVIFAFYIVGFLAVNLCYGNEQVVTQKIFYLPYVISATLILLAYPLVYLTEKLFGFISDFTLIELCDLNTPLLRELSQKVPGTFQHSLQVANLAEEVMFHIGGNPLLVRAGAMYHDIGKIDNPRYFTENQVGGVNPHNEILPEESARIIIGHVIKGVERAKAHRLPEQVIDFIRTHHGTTTVGFFLTNFIKEHRGEKVNEDIFRYPGPIPFSKETAVLMMADGVEAASRSMKTHDALMINDLVDRIIDYKVKENQFINSDITFKDITIIKKIFKKRLMNMYHVRIEYPR